jgi:hypothetical protein
VQQFKTARKKTQAQLISDWYLAGNIPQNVGRYVTAINTDPSTKTNVSTAVGTAALAAGFTSEKKGVFSGSSGEMPDNLFDGTLVALRHNLEDPFVKLMSFKPDEKYKPTIFDDWVPTPEGNKIPNPLGDPLLNLRRHLTFAGFDTLKAGIY